MELIETGDSGKMADWRRDRARMNIRVSQLHATTRLDQTGRRFHRQSRSQGRYLATGSDSALDKIYISRRLTGLHRSTLTRFAFLFLPPSFEWRDSNWWRRGQLRSKHKSSIRAKNSRTTVISVQRVNNKLIRVKKILDWCWVFISFFIYELTIVYKVIHSFSLGNQRRNFGTSIITKQMSIPTIVYICTRHCMVSLKSVRHRKSPMKDGYLT